MNNTFEIYIHIPFCVKKCNYCDFLSFPQTSEEQGRYIAQLLRELTRAAVDYSGMQVSSVFIGGGTPSILPEIYITRIMETIRSCYSLTPNAEISIECNPGSTMRHKYAAYREAGINRLSIGLQSADNAELRMLGRSHNFEEFLKSYQGARMEGFDNINVDLINCIPMQSLKTWRKTLRTVLMLKPEHVSVYNLIIEEGTPFFDMRQSGLLMMPSEEEQEAIDSFTKEYMDKQNYHRYEISNWSREGHECRHNIGYWTGVPYVGFGLGASSYFGNVRWKNTTDYRQYMSFDMEQGDASGLRTEVVPLTREAQMEEFMYLGLRMLNGVSASDFLGRFGQHIDSVYGKVLDKNIISGLMESRNGRYRLTDRGLDVSNVVMSEFLLG